MKSTMLHPQTYPPQKSYSFYSLPSSHGIAVVSNGSPLYCIFLILHITLLRRAPGYNEEVQLRIKLWSNAGVWVGNLLNLILYVPYGGVSWQWRHEGKKIVGIGFALSMFCEALQYLTRRGMADVNDVLFTRWEQLLACVLQIG